MPRETLEAVRDERDQARAAADRWQQRALQAETLIQLIKTLTTAPPQDDA